MHGHLPTKSRAERRTPGMRRRTSQPLHELPGRGVTSRPCAHRFAVTGHRDEELITLESRP
jgi:hypothetical protein